MTTLETIERYAEAQAKNIMNQVVELTKLFQEKQGKGSLSKIRVHNGGQLLELWLMDPIVQIETIEAIQKAGFYISHFDMRTASIYVEIKGWSKFVNPVRSIDSEDNKTIKPVRIF